MSENCVLSHVTKEYLEEYQRIFDEMRRGMRKACLTDSISGNFIRQMIPHHQGAINMSRNILKYTTCIPLQEIALGIISEQIKSIEDMKKALPCCQMLRNSSQELCEYQKNMGQIMEIMFEGMENACANNEVSDNFMREMIPHHEGAVRMSKNALKHSICRQLHPILEAIIESQEKGICQMKQLLQEGSCSCGK
ncbi:MAG: DUF305 domain-containing protein [Roseburia sp.]|nr:DUF305 domain-containing protein [Roseburia sp.]